jgi:hypothetical protein
METLVANKTTHHAGRHPACSFCLVADLLRQHEPWIRELRYAAQDHIKQNVLPSLRERYGFVPPLMIEDYQVPSRLLALPSTLLTPILAVGTLQFWNAKLDLLPRSTAVFGLIPGHSTRFDAKAFDAGLSMATLEHNAVRLDRIVDQFLSSLNQGGLDQLSDATHETPRCVLNDDIRSKLEWKISLFTPQVHAALSAGPK